MPATARLVTVPAAALVVAAASTACTATDTTRTDASAEDASPATTVFPHTDPDNAGGWVLNAAVSDEFDAEQLDEDKWHIQGTGGHYFSNFIGRAPSQFSLDNVRLEDGRLKIQTRWEPDYPFNEEPDGKGVTFENITTSAVISHADFRYGYMEIRAKAADASISSAFWMTGSASELDVFEHFGRPAQRHKVHLETEMWSSVHDWNEPPPNSVWTERRQLPFRVADDFNVYACEWSPEGLKFFVNGELLDEVKAADVEGWPLNGPIRVWVDSETFPWHGVPTEEDLPVDFEIDYIRVWQQPADE